MWRSVSPEHFKESAKSAKNPGEYGTWTVGDRYELVEGFIVNRSEDDVYYRPLEEVPDLFFKFAKLHKSPDFERDALAWVSRYGFPSNRGVARNPENNKGELPFIMKSERELVPTPSPEVLEELSTEIWDRRVLSLDWLRKQVEYAWFVLELYEITLNGDAEMVRSLTGDDFIDGEEEIEDLKAQGLNEDDIFLDGALYMVMADVWSELLNNPCTPQMQIIGDDFPAKPSQLTQYWGFENLIGAMYLQMMWIMTSGSTLTRCEFCELPISSRSQTGRASRPDKRFCDDSCRQAYHRKRRRENGDE